MYAIKEDAENGLRSFIEDQKALDGECTIRLEQFDTVHETVYPSTDVNSVPDFILHPRGGTALVDAMGKTITDFGAELAAKEEPDRPGNVIVVIITDGGENSSVEYTRESVATLVKEHEEKYNWKFVFLAANQDAITVGASYGMQANSSLTFGADSQGTAAVFAAASNYATTTRSVGDYAFTDADRASTI